MPHIYGIHPVLEALRAGTVRRLRVAERAGERLRDVTNLAATEGVRVERVPLEVIERLAHGATHQGVVADVETERSVGLRELAEGASPLIVVLDGIEDPHNLGAILRTADAAGVSGVVVQTRGYQPQPISNKALETEISNYARTSTITDAEGWTYQQEGHQFYVLNFPSVPATWAFDTSTSMWSRRGTWNPEVNDFDVWSPRTHTYAFGRHLVGDRTSGRLSVLDVTFGTESNGDAIRRVLVPAPLWCDPNEQRLYMSRFEVILQNGLGTQTGQGSAPVAMLETSHDAVTWSNQRTCSAGRAGQYMNRVFWLRNGASTLLWVPRLTVSDPIPWRVIGAEFEATGVRGAGRAA